jgi:hypothetical protein
METAGIPWHFSGSSPLVCPSLPDALCGAGRALARRDRQRPDPPEHCPEQASCQMTLGQQQPVVPRMFHQTHAGFDKALLHTGERPPVSLFPSSHSPV